MRIAAWAVAVSLTFAPCLPARAAAADDVMAVVKEYLGYMNEGAVEKFVKLCAPQTIIIDDFAPHTWQGPTACMDWLTAFAAYDSGKAITPRAVTIGKPWRVSVTGDVAYVVLPATYKYVRAGKKVTESGSVWTLSLQKGPEGWRIKGWAWGQHK
jgi:ketosteroid isomerase-like protein